MADMYTGLNPIFGDYINNYLSKGQSLSDLPFQPYEGNRFAGPSGLQQQAFTGVGGLTSNPGFGQANNMYQQAFNRVGAGYEGGQITAPDLSGVSGIQAQAAGPISAGQIGQGLDRSNSGLVQSFMNPYQQNVTDIAKRELTRNNNVQQAARDASAVKAGAFGGSRQGLVDAEASRNLNMQMQDVQNTGDMNAFNSAQQAINNQQNSNFQTNSANVNNNLDASKFNAANQQQVNLANAGYGLQTGLAGAGYQMDAARANQQNNQFGAGYNLNASNAMGNYAQGIGNIANQQTNSQQAIYDQQLRAGQQQQGLNQQPLDFGYQEFMRSLAYPQDQVKFQQGLMGGLNTGYSGQDGGNSWMQGLQGGAGMYGLLQQLFGNKP